MLSIAVPIASLARRLLVMDGPAGPPGGPAEPGYALLRSDSVADFLVDGAEVTDWAARQERQVRKGVQGRRVG